MYTVYHQRDRYFEQWLANSGFYSAIEADVELDPDGHYVMLSTCAYVFEDARSVLHGLLQPVSSAAGVAMKEFIKDTGKQA